MSLTVRKIAHRPNMEKGCHHDSDFNFFQVAFILADNEDRHTISVEFDFGLNRVLWP